MQLQTPEKEVEPADMKTLRMAIAGAGAKRCELARMLGYSEQQFSMFLTERRKAPDGFVRRAATALRMLNQADQLRNRLIEEAAEELRPQTKTEC